MRKKEARQFLLLCNLQFRNKYFGDIFYNINVISFMHFLIRCMCSAGDQLPGQYNYWTSSCLTAVLAMVAI